MFNTEGGFNAEGGQVAPSVPQGVASITSVTPDETSASISYSYVESDATGFKLRVNGSVVTDQSTSNPIILNGLTADTVYTAEILPYNAVGDGATWSAISNFRTDEAPVVPVAPVGDITIGTIVVSETTASVPFSYDNTDETGYEYQLDNGTIISTSSPINLNGLIAGSTYSIKVRAVNAVGSGDWSDSVSFTTEAEVIAPVLPQSIPTITGITKTETTASVSYSYAGDDSTGVKLRLNDSIITDYGTGNPIELTGLTDATSYTVELLAYNDVGDGEWSASSSFTTDAIVISPERPKGIVTIVAISVTKTTASIAFTYNKSDELSFQYRINGGEPLAANNPFDISGLVSGNSYTVQIRAINATGNGDWSTVASFTTSVHSTAYSVGITQNTRLSASSAKFNGTNVAAQKITQSINLAASSVNLHKGYNPFGVNIMQPFSYLTLDRSVGVVSSNTEIIQFLSKSQVFISALDDINVNNVRLYSGDSIHQFKSSYQH